MNGVNGVDVGELSFMLTSFQSISILGTHDVYKDKVKIASVRTYSFACPSKLEIKLFLLGALLAPSVFRPAFSSSISDLAVVFLHYKYSSVKIRVIRKNIINSIIVSIYIHIDVNVWKNFILIFKKVLFRTTSPPAYLMC